MVGIKTPAGRLAFQIFELDLNLVKEHEEYICLIEVDLIHNVHFQPARKQLLCWRIFTHIMAF
jgi:hypothetical protein